MELNPYLIIYSGMFATFYPLKNTTTIYIQMNKQ